MKRRLEVLRIVVAVDHLRISSSWVLEGESHRIRGMTGNVVVWHARIVLVREGRVLTPFLSIWVHRRVGEKVVAL